MKPIVRALLPSLLLFAFGPALAGENATDAPGEEAKPANPVLFWELASNDQEASVEFFRGVFDWKIEYNERIEFYQVSTGGKSGDVDGYIFTLTRAKLPFVTVYIQVEDIEAKAKLVEEKGGLVVLPPTVTVPGGPRICLFNDPSGVTFAMIEPMPKEEAQE
jgi:predicted enzyme related to lactoylglutathione lyase